MAEQLRLFVACELPGEVRDALASLQEGLRRAGARDLRWVRPEGIHLTLKFLGGVPESRRSEIEGALSAAVEPFAARVRPVSVGGFGGARLRVVWVGLDGDVPALAKVAGRVESALEPLGFPRESRPFAPHLTLARVPDHVPPETRRELSALIQRYMAPEMPAVTLSGVSLMQSTLGPGGAVYDRLAAFPLAAG